jgi:Na+/H+ antiporter NhaC
VVDATAAPIASIVPISSWVGFEISLIQAELDIILANDPNPEIATTGFAVFLETIKYRYYCIFMLMFIPLLIIAGRDFGPMLIAERIVKVYGRTDGGPGAALAADGQTLKSHNAPKEDTPCRWWNMAFPIVALIGYIFYLLVWTGQQAGVGGESFIELIEISNAYQALLWGTMAAALTALLFYFVQDKKDGQIIWFNVKGYINKMKRFVARHRGMCRRGGEQEMVALDEADEVEHAKVLVDYREAMSSFLIGMEKIFGALVALTLAWATGAIMTAVGLNRFFGEILTNPALDYRILPTLTFIIAILIAFSTGTSWGTMTIMFPLVLVPSYEASGGDPVIFYGVTAGILAGAVAGDHASPISDTTILASMASECQILQHVRTQAPYALMVSVWSVLVGTLPSGRGSFANWVSILLGFLAMLFHVVATSEFAINKTGRFDIFTEIYLRCTKDKEFLLKLKEDTVTAYATGESVPLEAGDKLVENSDDKAAYVDANSSSIISGDIPKQEQALADGVEGAVLVKSDVVAEKPEQAQELTDEPEIEEHFSGEEQIA